MQTGSFHYHPAKIMMASYNGNAIFKELEAKIKEGKPLDDVDMVNLIFLPLMGNDASGEDFREGLAVRSVKLAQTIEDKTKRNACIAAAFAFGSKYLNEEQFKKLMEVLKMTDLAVMFVQEARQERELEIAQEALKEGASIEFVAKITKLDIEIIRTLKKEML